MKDITKYQGIIPAFYACYDDNGEISPERVEALTRHLIAKGVKGVYVGGSSGECIYQSVADRKLVLEHVMKAAEGKLTHMWHATIRLTVKNWQHMQNHWALTQLLQFLRFISICRSMRSQNTGMIFPVRHRIQTL